MAYDRQDFRDDLSAFYNDTGHTIWTANQKNSAINQAIDALWPECKSSKKDESKVLVADTYLYTPTGQPTDMGYSQAFLEQESDEEYLLLRRVSQYREDVSGVLKWIIDIPKDIVDNNDAGKKILLRYHAPFVHYTADGTDQDVPYLPVFYYAQMVLCLIMLQKAGSSDVRVWRDQIPEFRALWLQSKKDNLVLSMTRHIGLRRR